MLLSAAGFFVLNNPGSRSTTDVAALDDGHEHVAQVDSKASKLAGPTARQQERGASYSVRGVLRDQQGRPARGMDAWVELSSPLAGQRHMQEPNAAGAFEFAGLSRGTWQLRARADGFRLYRARLELDEANAGLRHDVRLEPMQRIEVFVRNGKRLASVEGARRAGLGEARIVASQKRPSIFHHSRDETASSWLDAGRSEPASDVVTHWGTLALEEPLPAHVSLVMGQVVLASRFVKRGAREVTLVCDPIKLEHLVQDLGVRVSSASNSPIAQCRFELAGRVLQADPIDNKGSYTLRNLPAGRHLLTVRAKGYAYHERSLEILPQAERQRLAITLEKECKIHARVRGSSEAAAKLRFALLRLRSSPSGLQQDLLSTQRIDEQGLIEIDELPVGRYALRVEANSELVSKSVRIDLASSGSVAECDVPLRQACRLDFVAGQLAWLYAKCTVLDEHGIVVFGAWIHPKGRHHTWLPAGSYRLEVRGEKEAVRSTRFVLPPRGLSLPIGR